MNRFDRRALLARFGYAGLVASTLLRQRNAHAAGGRPRRLILFYTPGGFFKESWAPTWSGADATRAMDVPLAGVTFGRTNAGKLQNVLDVLDDPRYAGLKGDLNVIDGVDMRAVERGDEHHNGIKAALRGRPIDTDDAGPFPGHSIDRVIGANLFLSEPRPVHLKSACLNLGLGNYGYQGAIRDCAEGGTSLEPSRVDQMWDMLFKDFMPAAGGTLPTGPSPALVDAHERRKILSAVSRGELDALKRVLGSGERLALDRHLEAMNEITLQVENSYKTAQAAGTTPSTAPKLVARPDGSLDPKRQLAELGSLGGDVIVNAMAHDRIRVAVIHTFGQNNNTSYWYPGGTGSYHNGVCHGGYVGGQVSAPAMSAGRTLLKMYLELLLKLKSVPEGSGTMLDSTTVATFSDMSHGDHAFRIPTLFLVGGGGGLDAMGRRALKTGRYLKYVDRGHTDYLIALAHLMGVTEYQDKAGARKPLIQIGSARYNKGPLPGFTG